MKRALLTGVLVGLFQGVAGAAVIADLSSDFTPTTFPVGWQYLRNTGQIEVDPDYVPLLWHASLAVFDVDGVNLPAGGDFTLIGATFAHPGPGLDQVGGFDHYLVLAYTLQPGEGGAIELVNGLLAGLDPTGPSNGWDVRTFVGSSEVGLPLVFAWSDLAMPFSRSLGVRNPGDTIYVALGPNGSHLFDTAALDFTLTSTPVDDTAVPEPATTLAAIGLATALGARRRSSSTKR